MSKRAVSFSMGFLKSGESKSGRGWTGVRHILLLQGIGEVNFASYKTCNLVISPFLLSGIFCQNHRDHFLLLAPC